MTGGHSKDQENITRAFELAYFIISDKGIALRLVEEAWCSLDVVLGDKTRHRKSYRRLLGFMKGEERARPLRTKIRFSHEQMLQWLVYAHCDSWERATEYGDSLYSPCSEDMVVRYIKHLVRITSNRNSFYVTLGVTRLLYDYGTQEVRLMYDILTTSDTARMKDMDYFRKQKAILIDEMLERFDGILRTETSARRERRFESQPMTTRLVGLVSESLRRFTPWDTSCALQDGFDPTAVPSLYFPGTNLAEEDQIEMTRVHAVLHPECFSKLINGLTQFVQELPLGSPDKTCKYGPPEAFLAVPHFYGFSDKDRDDDRFNPPKLKPEDYLRLERSREALARRRKAHKPHSLYVCVDDIERARFDPSRTAKIQLELEPGESVIEVRGEDSKGALPIAMLIACSDDIPSGGSFSDSIVSEAGAKVTIELHPVRNQIGEVERVKVEIRYAETKLTRAFFWYAQRAWLRFIQITTRQNRRQNRIPDYARLVAAGVILALIAGVVALTWLRYRPQPGDVPPLMTGGPTPPSAQSSPSVPTTVTPTPPVQKPSVSLVARASWSRNPEVASEAIRLETERSEIAKIEIDGLERNLSFALPQMDTDNVAYTHYRVTLLAAQDRIWDETLRAPRIKPSVPAHVMNVSLPKEQHLKPLLLRFEGKSRGVWQLLGEVTLKADNR